MFQGYPDTRRAGTCRSCGRPIVWIDLVASGTAHPFNPPLHVVTEQVSLFDTPATADFVAVSHFATCPYAYAHRPD